jgi:predicted outer membrane protein
MSQIELTKINRRIDDMMAKLAALTERFDKIEQTLEVDKQSQDVARAEDEDKIRQSINASVTAAIDAIKPEIKNMVKAATRNLTA